MNLYLFQPQYTLSVNGVLNSWLPYSAGSVWAYAAQFAEVTTHFTLKEIVFQREPLCDILDRMQDPAVCGFSCYMWNRRYCLALAQAIKQRWPRSVTVFGGPEVNGKMLQYDFIDTLVLGEGEETFAQALRQLGMGQRPTEVASKKRLQDLDIPSPYTTGVFEPLLRSHPDLVWAMTLETNRGCPYQCTFCDWGSLTYTKVKKFGLERIVRELEWARSRPISSIYVADANFGIFKERDLEIARLLRDHTEGTRVDLITVQNSKQSTEVAFEIGKVLGSKYAGVAVAMQSMHDKTLDAIKRKNLDINNIAKLMTLSEQYQVPTYTELILGMPEETLDSWYQGITDLLEAGQHNSIEVWFAQMIENSEMAQPDYRRRYGLETIKTKYYASRAVAGDDGIDEESEIVCATGSMTLDDIIEAYLFGWLIIHFHTTGYSQVVSRYLRNLHGVAYRDFYQQLMASMHRYPDIMAQRESLRSITHTFLTRGEIPDGINQHLLHTTTSRWLYQNRHRVMDFVLAQASCLAPLPAELCELQRSFIFDPDHQYPLSITAPFDFKSGRQVPVKYVIHPQLERVETGMNSMLSRRQGKLKNKVEIEYM